ncbi:DDIT3 protein, partial [Brachypteracias leptosomus]|nr:DDIT3 protein [Brachypteracias leptosomus]
MAAEGLPAGDPGWELEAWYQDLQEVLAAAELGGPALPWGVEQGAGGDPGSCELDAALAAELQGAESATGTEAAAPRGSASGQSSPPGLGTKEEEATAVGHGVKRKRCPGSVVPGRELAKRREWANEQRVLELTAQNERLREEIGRLSAEVEHTRAALIDRILSLRRA